VKSGSQQTEQVEGLAMLLTAGDIARLAQVSEKSVRRWDQLRKLPGRVRLAIAYLRERPDGIYLDEDNFLWRLVPDPTSEEGEQLVLRVTSPHGCSERTSYTIERPKRWRSPYGLR